MLSDYALLLVGAVLVNNFVLVQFLGLCPFMGVSNKLENRHWHVCCNDLRPDPSLSLQLPHLQLSLDPSRFALFANNQLYSRDRCSRAIH